MRFIFNSPNKYPPLNSTDTFTSCFTVSSVAACWTNVPAWTPSLRVSSVCHQWNSFADKLAFLGGEETVARGSRVGNQEHEGFLLSASITKLTIKAKARGGFRELLRCPRVSLRLQEISFSGQALQGREVGPAFTSSFIWKALQWFRRSETLTNQVNVRRKVISVKLIIQYPH